MTDFHYYPLYGNRIAIYPKDGETIADAKSRFLQENGMEICDASMTTDYYANRDMAGAFWQPTFIPAREIKDYFPALNRARLYIAARRNARKFSEYPVFLKDAEFEMEQCKKLCAKAALDFETVLATQKCLERRKRNGKRDAINERIFYA